jgi:hypothetical protein
MLDSLFVLSGFVNIHLDTKSLVLAGMSLFWMVAMAATLNSPYTELSIIAVDCRGSLSMYPFKLGGTAIQIFKYNQ